MWLWQRARRLFGNMKLVTKLLLLYGTAFLVIAFFVGITYSASVQMMTRETDRFTAQITNQLKISMDHALDTINNQLFNSYNLRVLIGGNIEQLSASAVPGPERLRYELRMASDLNEFIYSQQWIRWAAVVDINDIV